MSSLERAMKERGETKVWRDVLDKEGKAKNISSSQIGQKLLMDEAMRIAPLFIDWIEQKSGRKDRAILNEYFASLELVEEKILQTLFYLAGSIHLENESKFARKDIRRHKKIATLQRAIYPELEFDLVFRIIEVVVDFSHYYDTERVMEIKGNKFDKRVKYTCTLSEKIVDEIAFKSVMAFYPTPILEKPLDWVYYPEADELIGGFHTYQYPLVRAGNRKVNYSLYGQPVFDAVNYIQSQKWIVNERVLRVMQKDVKEPVKSDFVKTKFPEIDGCHWDIKLDEDEHGLSNEEVEQIKETRRKFIEISSLYADEKRDYESALGKYRSVKLAMQIAEEYVGKEFYFPHNYDFRGRIYPITVGLTPQGSSAVKALLLYADTKPVTERGMQWNWAYLATLFGDDKLSFDKRVERGMELINTDYREADEPYEFLSHQIELQKWIRDDKYEPNTRIHVDASCSGSQICSAMIGDRSGAEATNVLPVFDENGVQIRQDAYMRVAEKAIENTEFEISLEQDDELKESLNVFYEQLKLNGRKYAKNPTMVSIYGGTVNSMRENVADNLRAFGVERKHMTPKKAYRFAKIIKNSIGDTLVGGKLFESYIQQMSALIGRANKPMIWTTIDGFHVYSEKNKLLKPKRIKCLLPNSRKVSYLSKKNYSNDVSVAKMKSGSSPNFVHTVDSTLLRMVALKMQREGIVWNDFIHDSFGCHANDVDLMVHCTKTIFENLMATDIIARLHMELVEQVPDDKKSQKALSNIRPPKLTDFDPTAGGLSDIHKSEWFFA